MIEPPRKVVMCVSPDKSKFADDVITACAKCGTLVCHRPHMPKDALKMCIACVTQELRNDPDPEFAITPHTIEELALYYAKPKGGKQ